MKKYTTLELFCAFSTFYLINEVEIISLFENFSKLKENEKYNILLDEYHFDGESRSHELAHDILILNENKEVVLLNNARLISFTMKQEKILNINESTTKEEKNIIGSFINDFRNLETEKETNRVLTKTM